MFCPICSGEGTIRDEDGLGCECDECDGTGYVCEGCGEPPDWCDCDEDDD